VGTRPDVVEVLFATLALLLQLLVEFCGLGSLGQDFTRRRWPGGVLVRHSSHFVPWTLHAAVVAGLQVGRGALGVSVCAD